MRPSIYAALQVIHVIEAGFRQIHGCVKAAHAVMAVNYDRCTIGQLVLAQRNKVHRNMDMPWQRAKFNFFIFADIKQEHRFVFMQPLM